MQTFSCSCGNRLFFENSLCVNCQTETGFLPDRLILVPIKSVDEQRWTSELVPKRYYRKCANYLEHQVCNWMIAEDDEHDYCVSCRLNKIIPDLTKPGNLKRWYRMERGKRRTLYNLFKIGLRVIDREADPAKGLEFRFMEDVKQYDPYTQELVTYQQIMTGHDAGTITINIREADHSHREAVRENMKEPYRTTLGHVRHETGHYFWDRLVVDAGHLEAFRALFGDERHDYQHSLQLYYQNGPHPDWQENFISAYASAHPWEDWAETWAHYLHITDTMETAYDFGFAIEGRKISLPLPLRNGSLMKARDYFKGMSFDAMLTDWLRLTIVMNALNRSMGLRDAYPFAVSAKVGDKLRFVHQVVSAEVARQKKKTSVKTSKRIYAANPAYTDKPG
ncbi:MAG: hypothetical protein GC149_09420 [Gammaproteobacteria bacterium]|nr:hypothetical protein [Gammaproteobacteria bacterium]